MGTPHYSRHCNHRVVKEMLLFVDRVKKSLGEVEMETEVLQVQVKTAVGPVEAAAGTEEEEAHAVEVVMCTVDTKTYEQSTLLEMQAEAVQVQIKAVMIPSEAVVGVEEDEKHAGVMLLRARRKGESVKDCIASDLTKTSFFAYRNGYSLKFNNFPS